MISFSHQYFMQQALVEAEKALSLGEIPVGAVVVYQHQIIAKAHNLTETLQDVTAHAEMLALTSAANTLNFKYLNGCALYVTLEPCLMCGGALSWSQVSEIYFGAADSKRGCLRVGRDNLFANKIHVEGNILAQECEDILKKFFQKLRN